METISSITQHGRAPNFTAQSPENKEDTVGGANTIESVRGSNQSWMRAHNERLVMTLIRQIGPMPKAEIARLTGLSAQTVSVIMRALEADGLLVKGEPMRGKVGQPSVPMSLARDGAYFLGLKVGRRSLDLILTDFLGAVVSRVTEVHHYPHPDSVVEFANSGIEKLLADLSPAQRDRVAGLGIAIPFRLWDWAKALNVAAEDMVGWRERDVAHEIARAWDFPVYLQNDASSACGAELVFGDQDKPKDFLYFFIGFFIGGGIVMDNALYTGRTGNAAALGSMPICGGDGQVRQLVDVASLSMLERSVQEKGGESASIWAAPAGWNVADDILSAWVDRAAEGMAYAIMASACIVDFDCVVIDGWLPQDLRAALVARTTTAIRTVPVAGIDVPEIRPGTIGPDARALGAASLPLSERFLVERRAILKS